jgi:ribosomal protein L37AE/L43A
MHEEDRTYLCPRCTNKIEYRRWKAGYRTCLPCGEKAAIEAELLEPTKEAK